ncbi:heparinase II/III family protein [Halomonas sp. A020]|uniref:heparinase II/III domain-containing protein n=1 Tax=Halomonas sp. A020 TaxID=2717374 RepID=UPI002490F494|nr:heparinase II/III family protein [Halomonas sp. A020]
MVEKDGGVEILVHPNHKPLFVPNSGNLYNTIDKEDKTIQLYFYSLAWVVPILVQGDEAKVAAALSVVSNIFDIPAEDERTGAWNMLWDDHAVCERLCVIIELLLIDELRFRINWKKFEDHLEKTYGYIEKLVRSDRWLNNNHRLFHFLASFVYYHYKCNDEKVAEFASHISNFCHDLIDIETGFAREQCISYCFFDINVVEKVMKTLSGLSIRIDFDVDDVHKKLLHHINAIAFPDDTLPASGDTPYGLKLSSFQKKFNVSDSDLSGYWARLDKLGFYRGKSKDEKFQFLMLDHNAESGHGHYSPLHIDLWCSEFGPVLADAGGPYKYGDKQRYNWFRALMGHNSLAINDVGEYSHKMVDIVSDRSGVSGFIRYDNASHSRIASAYENEFIISENIFSEKDWSIYYSFAPGVYVDELNPAAFVLQNEKGHKLLFSFSSESLPIVIKKTSRCIGHSLSVEGDSLHVSGGKGMMSYAISIKSL